MNFFDHENLGNHLLQLCPKVVEHPVYLYRMSFTLCVIVRVIPLAIFQMLDQGKKLSYIDVNMVNMYILFSAQHACSVKRNNNNNYYYHHHHHLYAGYLQLHTCNKPHF